MGWFLEKMFNTKYWDYSDLKFNIKGRVCLKNSIFWGILCVIFIIFIHPVIEKNILLIPSQILYFVNGSIVLIIIIDTVVSVRNVISINKGIEKVKEIGDIIIEKLEELKSIKDSATSKLKGTKANANEKIKNIEEMIDELKQKQEFIKSGMYKKIESLKKAFPTMKSEYISQFIEARRNNRNKGK